MPPVNIRMYTNKQEAGSRPVRVDRMYIAVKYQYHRLYRPSQCFIVYFH